MTRETRASVLLGLGVALILLAFTPPAIYSKDGNSMLAVAESLVTHRGFAVAPQYGRLGHDGLYYSPWYPLLSLLAVPFVFLGIAAGKLVGLSGHYASAVSASILPILLTGVTASATMLLAIRLGSTARRACLVAVYATFGSVALTYARTFFAEPLLATLIVCGMYFAIGGGRKQTIAASACSALAILAKPAGAAVGPVLAAYYLVKRRSPMESMMPLLGTFVGGCLYAVYNYIRSGDPFTLPPTVSTGWCFDVRSFPEGLLGLLFSPGRGLIWFCPAVVVGLAGYRHLSRDKRPDGNLILAMFAAMLCLHAFYVYWSGGWAWGPRFLLPVTPGLFALAAFAAGRWKQLLTLLSLIGFIISAPTLLSYYDGYIAEATARHVSEDALVWSPGKSAIIHQWGAAYRTYMGARRTDPRKLVERAGRGYSDSPEKQEILQVVAVWWWMLPAAGIPRVFGVAAALLMTASGMLLIRRAFLRADSDDSNMVSANTCRGSRD